MFTAELLIHPSILFFRGHNCSILHYGHAGAPNNKYIQDGDMWYVKNTTTKICIHLEIFHLVQGAFH